MLPPPVSAAPLACQGTVEMTVGDAVSQGVIANESLGYMVARTQSFLLRAGVKRKYLRFRQHLPTEMAHYACDCWDAEIMFSHGWVESVGVADRSAFDLNAHSGATGQELVAIEKLETPIKKQVVHTKKAAAGVIGRVAALCPAPAFPRLFAASLGGGGGLWVRFPYPPCLIGLQGLGPSTSIAGRPKWLPKK